MSDRRFVYFKRDGSLSKPVRLASLMVVAGQRVLVGHGPFSITQDGEPVGTDMVRLRTLDRLRRRLEIGDIGPVYRVKDVDGVVILKVREVAPTIRIIDTGGNSKADLFWSWVVAIYPEYHPQFSGAYVCKADSQHRYGNAVDVFFDTLAHQEIVFRDIVAGKCPVPVAHTISLQHIWSNDSRGVHPYEGEFHAHLHTDFFPTLYGYCGVRNG